MHGALSILLTTTTL